MIPRAPSLSARSLRPLRYSLAANLRFLSSRSATRPPHARLLHHLSQSSVRPVPKRSYPSFQLSSVTCSRHASTTAAQSPLEAAPAQPESSPYYTQPNTVFDELDVGSNVTPHIGYLKEMGLDFGWGPTATLEWLMEHIHVYLGTPWWATIILTAIAVRAGLFHFYTQSSDQSARAALLQPSYAPIQEKLRVAKESKDQILQQTIAKELKDFFKAAGLKPWKAFLPIALQIPLGFGNFRLMRNMYEIPVPGLTDGGILWFQDLTVGDPFMVLPLAMVAVNYWTLKATLNERVSTINPALAKMMRTVMPFLAGGFMCFYPACTQLIFLTTSSLGGMQSWLFLQAGFRTWWGMQPLKHHVNQEPSPRTITVQQGDKPKEEKKNVINDTYSGMKQYLSESMDTARKFTGQSTSPTGRSNRDLKAAQAYEQRRRREKAQEKFEREQEQQEERRAQEEKKRRRR